VSYFFFAAAFAGFFAAAAFASTFFAMGSPFSGFVYDLPYFQEYAREKRLQFQNLALDGLLSYAVPKCLEILILRVVRKGRQ